MMKFKQFLNETTLKDSPARQKEIDKDINHVIGLAKKHCSENIDMIINNAVPFRGGKPHGPFMIIDYSKGTRVSSNTGNMYTLLFDTNPKNASWPKRSKSIICANESSRAFGYAHSSHGVFALLPFNGVQIASTNEEDIWDTIPFNPPFKLAETHGYDLPDYGNTVSSGLGRLSGHGSSLPPKFTRTLTGPAGLTSTILKAVKNVDKAIKDNDENVLSLAGENGNFFDWFINVVKKSKSTEDAVDTILGGIHKPLTANLVGFSLLSGQQFATGYKGYADRNAHIGARHELWISGKCLAIRFDMWKDFRNKFMELHNAK